MKRVVKFRGKDAVTKEWRYGYFTEGSHGYYIASGSTGEIWLVDKDTVGQFTGLLDKNSGEIYEDDLIETTWSQEFEDGETIHDLDEVVWRNGCFFIDDGDMDWMLGENNEDVTIIGNKHDNPEMMTNGA